MLRLMKQKILVEEGNSPVNGETRAESTARCPPVIVTHVPVSIGSQRSPASANSSISSKGDEGGNTMESPTIVSLQGNKRLLHQISDASHDESPGESSPNTSTISDARSTPTSSKGEEKQSMFSQPCMKRQKLDNEKNTGDASVPAMLLTTGEDSRSLSPLHIFVRSQIEVFTATPAELSQPAPGRKQPIKLNQVGLRCIHCRHLPSRQRVKRAVCYPSSVARVYHSVSDMKFDHFSNCTYMPANSRGEFERLRANGAKPNGETKSRRSSSSTSQYYHDSALKMGMTDGPGGIFLLTRPLVVDAIPTTLAQPFLTPKPKRTEQRALPSKSTHELMKIPIQKILVDAANRGTCDGALHQTSSSQPETKQVKISLASHNDPRQLNPLHCFVRRHVEFFTANKQDIAAPAPGRKARVVLGQVGIRCVHCAKLPVKERVKRTVCYPPSVGAIYHAVSNIKFDHFPVCKGLSPEAREEFQTLKGSCSRRGTAGNNNGKRGSSSSSTAQYYRESAASKGLVDTEMGIFLQQGERKVDEEKPKSLEHEVSKTAIPAGMSALMQAISQAA